VRDLGSTVSVGAISRDFRDFVHPAPLRGDDEQCSSVASTEHTGKTTAVQTDPLQHFAAFAGTLYRHFPTREELLEGVYRTEVEKLAAAERKFAETMPPVDALRAWMLLFVDYSRPS
jgi:hypothetical protein